MTKIIIRIISSVGLWYLYITALEKIIIYFKESVDQGMFTWCGVSITLVSTIYFSLDQVTSQIFDEWTKN
ncbi:hypothetical protein UFOVP51_23 [uncultured Caudovirales phage]|uniref:Uncharacterized protein n=1 Tax=uncultured Caudovirales phage TaxID=2100421 RepID=A0A6J5KVN2_9CAUD|nr:hypothetical protein UFOVP51_23 [uncultured Caudovirales phage]CAB4241119.1 hypothetical protein UFOVP34_83 [uncultured Caudovirales phage]